MRLIAGRVGGLAVKKVLARKQVRVATGGRLTDSAEMNSLWLPNDQPNPRLSVDTPVAVSVGLGVVGDRWQVRQWSVDGAGVVDAHEDVVEHASPGRSVVGAEEVEGRPLTLVDQDGVVENGQAGIGEAALEHVAEAHHRPFVLRDGVRVGEWSPTCGGHAQVDQVTMQEDRPGRGLRRKAENRQALLDDVAGDTQVCRCVAYEDGVIVEVADPVVAKDSVWAIEQE